MSLQDLIFREGLSSRDSADEISGRGVGLAAVKAELDRLGGTMQVESRSGAGTCFRFHLPFHTESKTGVHTGVHTGAAGRRSAALEKTS
jgi:chemotaxis protein histidine kinase CheA